MGSITVSPKALTDTLAGVKPAVGKGVLSGVLISSDSSDMIGPIMRATDGDVHVTKALVGAWGSVRVLVPHAEMVKVAKAFAGRTSVLLEQDETSGSLVCSNGTRKVTVRTLRIEDFPERPNIGGELIVRSTGAQLRPVLLKADVFRSSDETRPVLTGMHVKATMLEVTDSYRLARFRIPGRYTGSELEVLLSGRGCALAAKHMPKDDTEVDIHAYRTHSVISWPGTSWVSRNIEGSWPNFDSLIPTDGFQHTVRADRAALLSGAKLAGQFLHNNAPLRLVANGDVRIHGNTMDVGEFEEIIADATVTHHNTKANGRTGRDRDTGLVNEIEIGFSPEFFRDIMEHVSSDTVRIRLISPLRPAVVENCDNDDEIHLIMPIRLNV
jgi:DNA polymerase III subunit beta